jgi:hypothetical protein
MSRFPVSRLIALMEVPARPFARCLAHYWQKGHNTTRLFTGLMGFMIVGPLNLVLKLAGIPTAGTGEWHFVLVFVLPLILITVCCEMFISRFARRIGSSQKPSAADWLLFWGAPAAGMIVFLLSSV